MENSDAVYDEDKAIKFIREELPQNISEKYSDDEILFIIDTIWDFYEKEGMLTINLDVVEEEESDPKKLIDYVKKEIKRDNQLMMDPADIPLIVKAELDYEESIEDFI
ncbi:MAG: hypothetical protein K2M10_02260 [Muribaculaceae bacterium]|nr:hypothetical protein [Muribaculaceae bacterium]